MTDPVRIRFGGYGPPSTTHSRALKMIGDALEGEFGDAVDIKYVWNVMDFGYRSEDVLWLAESGVLTVVYQSTSYLTARVPELGFVDLPFLFPDNDAARSAMDGALGDYLKRRIEDRVDYRVLGFFENGFRHISNRLRPIHTPADLAGMKIRVLPSRIQARTFELLGATPLAIDLTEAIAGITAGTIDAQENPLANTVTYGVHTFHRHHTLSNHFYISRGVFANRAAFEAMPAAMQEVLRRAVAEATVRQRELAVAEEEVARQALVDEGCEIVELTAAEQALFADTVRPLHDEAKATFGPEMFALLQDG
jgi:TRAP-type C4-dicarboxylate transport system substrate-binding protein